MNEKSQSRTASILVALLLALGECAVVAAGPAPHYDLECAAAGNEIEVRPLNSEVHAWMEEEGFFPWIWVYGRRMGLPERHIIFSPGYRNDIAWLTYAESHGWRVTPNCWAIARRYTPQN